MTKARLSSLALIATLVSAAAFGCAGDVANPTGAPDRVLQGMGVSVGPYHGGDEVVVDFVVRNGGAAAAAAVTAAIRLSADSSITEADTLLATLPVGAIAPSGVAPVQARVTIPTSLVPGIYYLGVVVGTDPSVPEASLANNVLAIPEPVDVPIASLANRLGAVGAPGFCALTPADATYCWGLNYRHEFGLAEASAGSALPVASTVPTFGALAGGNGGDHLCGIAANGVATCWGRDDFGFLGDGGAPVAVAQGSPPTTVAGGIAWAEINVSQLSACGVSRAGVGYCWGSNQRGEVGSANVPLSVSSVPSNGEANRASITTVPRSIDGGLTFKSVVAGWTHACGIATNGNAYCWGDNSSGQLGIGSADTAAIHRSPALVVGGHSFVQLSLGARQSCGITTAHEAYCWGANAFGQLGDGTTTDRASPALVVGGLRFGFITTASGFADFPSDFPTAVQGSIAHTCALTETGLAYCWGFNKWGQLGDGTTNDHSMPTAVLGQSGLRFSAIRAGGSATCALNYNTAWCWGNNVDGQLGNGSTVNATVPTTVGAPFSTL